MIMFGFGLLTLSALLLEIDLYEGLENAIAAGIGAFSLLLLALSITAYRKTGLRLILYGITIFALFAIQQFLDYTQNIFPEFDTPEVSAFVDSLTLVILVLFFLAIVRSKVSSEMKVNPNSKPWKLKFSASSGLSILSCIDSKQSN